MIGALWVAVFGTFLDELLSYVASAPRYTVLFSAGAIAYLVDGRLLFGLITGMAASLTQYVIFGDSTSRFWSTFVSIFLGAVVIFALYPAKTKPQSTATGATSIPALKTLVVGLVE